MPLPRCCSGLRWQHRDSHPAMASFGCVNHLEESKCYEQATEQRVDCLCPGWSHSSYRCAAYPWRLRSAKERQTSPQRGQPRAMQFWNDILQGIHFDLEPLSGSEEKLLVSPLWTMSKYLNSHAALSQPGTDPFLSPLAWCASASNSP